MSSLRSGPQFSHLPIALLLLAVILWSGGRYAVSATPAAVTYYVDDVAGDDGNSGNKERPWKTLDKVNTSSFQPGDKVLFRRGGVWRGTLVVPSSGVPDNPILFGAYGTGHNPVIMRTERFSKWKKYRDVFDSGGPSVVWIGNIAGARNSFGAVKNNKRLFKYNQWDKVSPGKMKNGAFYFPLNSGRFYYRNDAGDPGPLEIGVRPQAIMVNDRSNVIIDAIDAWGPGGMGGSGKTSGHPLVKIQGNSSNVVVKNLEISHGNSFGIRSTPETRNLKYLNLNVHDNASTGIYMNSQGGEIAYCKSYSNGLVDSDMGDRGGVGVLRGGDIRIHNNEIYGNGRNNDTADFEIGIVQAGKPVVIERNYIHDCVQGCIQIAEGGDNSIIAYNIISGFGNSAGKPSSPGMWSGIRIGGGAGGARGIQIYNNVIHGGRNYPGDTHAGLYLAWFDLSDVRVINNIFYNNRGSDVVVREAAEIGRAEFKNNMYYKAGKGPSWKWRGKTVLAMDQWRAVSGLGGHSLVADPRFLNPGGTFSAAGDFMLASNSPCIDGGIDVGITEDYRGNKVPQGRAPDIGVYETGDQAGSLQSP